MAALTGRPLVSAHNKFEALAAHDAFVFVHGALAALACGRGGGGGDGSFGGQPRLLLFL
jgi:hypothetical protein